LNTPRIIFAGTPEFALASLAALLDAGHDVVAVYTQPDRPAGRGRRLTASPVKVYAEAHKIPVLQPATFRDDSVVSEFESLQPDLMVVAAYGLILPQKILDIPRHGCLNVHASKLPRWRGAAPIQAAVLAADDASGISLMRMTAGLDCGPVFSSVDVRIGENETAGELQDRLATLGGELLVTDLQEIVSGRLVPVEQDESKACYAGKIQKQDAELDWSLPAADLWRRVRAYNPVPGAFFHAATDDSLRVKVWQASPVAGIEASPGTFVRYDSEEIVIACGQDGLRLEYLQLPGKRRAAAKDFVAQIDLG
jgi:methionyl-tRNA formyltransferase